MCGRALRKPSGNRFAAFRSQPFSVAPSPGRIGSGAQGTASLRSGCAGTAAKNRWQYVFVPSLCLFTRHRSQPAFFGEWRTVPSMETGRWPSGAVQPSGAFPRWSAAWIFLTRGRRARGPVPSGRSRIHMPDGGRLTPTGVRRLPAGTGPAPDLARTPYRRSDGILRLKTAGERDWSCADCSGHILKYQ